ncbi:hypothetical protein EIK77_002386, partial [Talaromyces pinophilus]
RERKTGYAGKWTGLYKLLSIDRETCIIALPNGPTPFHTTVVKPYQSLGENTEADKLTSDPGESVHDDFMEASPKANPKATPKADSKAKKQGKPLPRLAVKIPPYRPKSYLQATYEEPEHRFANSQRAEISGLLEKEVFEAVDIADIPPSTRIFNLQFMDETKNPSTDKAFKKSCLVIQAYNNINKSFVLIESPIIYRCSQYLILCLAPYKKDLKLYLQDII